MIQFVSSLEFLPLDQYDSSYILVYEQDRKEWEKREKTGSEKAVFLPKMYGPWREETEETAITQMMWLTSC